MANITIYEQDLTTGTVTEQVSNVAYVPGYAIMGPVNEPTLCRTLDEFKLLFGTKPYVFKNNQEYPSDYTSFKPSGTYARSGDYEKSYMYACELLRSGLSVLFERVMPDYKYLIAESDSNAIKFIGDDGLFKIEAKYPGYYGQNISYDLSTTSYYTLQNNLIASDVIQEDLSAGNYSFLYFGAQYFIVVNEDQFVCTNSIDDGEIITEIGGYTVNIEGDVDSDEAPIVTINDVQQNLLTTYNKYTSKTIIVKKGSILKSDSTIEVDGGVVSVTTLTDKIIMFNNATQCKVLQDLEFKGYLSVITVGSQLAYGSTIDGVAIQDEELKSKYNLKINIDVNAYGIPQLNQEIITFSFNPNDADYIGTKDFGDIVNVIYELPSSNTPTLVIENNNDTTNTIYGYRNTLKIPTEDDKVYKLDESNNKIEIVDEFSIDQLYNYLTNVDSTGLRRLLDKNEYDIKFITSGSYPVYGYKTNSAVLNMMQVAGDRGDCIALIDHADIEMTKELYETVNLDVYENNSTGENIGKYGAMFSPWGLYSIRTLGINTTMPGSFAYLKCLANSLKLNDAWYAIAGVTRGLVGDLIQLTYPISGAMSDLLQNGAAGDKIGRAINPIVNIKPYGNCIWGNRTLFKNDAGLVASSFLNIRMLSDAVKKAVYVAAKKMTFELNTDILWLNFKSEIIPTLDSMIAGNGLSNYKISRKSTNKKATVACVIRLYAVEAVEDWDITIELSDSYISVE